MNKTDDLGSNFFLSFKNYKSKYQQINLPHLLMKAASHNITFFIYQYYRAKCLEVMKQRPVLTFFLLFFLFVSQFQQQYWPQSSKTRTVDDLLDPHIVGGQPFGLQSVFKDILIGFLIYISSL